MIKKLGLAGLRRGWLLAAGGTLLFAGHARAQDNTSYGAGALSKVTTGARDTALGLAALNFVTSGSDNTAVGRGAMFRDVDGSNNTAVGSAALYWCSAQNNTAVGSQALSGVVTGNDNTAMGYNALPVNVSSENTAVGSRALMFNLGGTSNTALGVKSMQSNTTGGYNVALGVAALINNADGSDNVAVGAATLLMHTHGQLNTALGRSALQMGDGGSYCTALGNSALLNDLADNNTAAGSAALFSNTTGTGNAALGVNALWFNVTGSFNTGLGFGAGSAYSGLSNTTAIGAHTVVSASNTIRLGDTNITSIGGQVGWSSLSDARFKTQVTEDVPGLAFIDRLRPVTFHWDVRKLDAFQGAQSTDAAAVAEKEARKYTGFLAQEVEAAARQTHFDFSGVVKPGNDKTPYQLTYSEFVVPLVKAVQEQQAAIKDQQRQIESLRAAVAGNPPADNGGSSRGLALGTVLGALGALLALLGVRRARGLLGDLRAGRALRQRAEKHAHALT
jgi:hypothetical protein